MYSFSNEIIVFECLTFLFLHLLFVFILNRIHKFYHSKSAISIVHLSTVFAFVAFYLFVTFEYSNLLFVYDKKYAFFVQNGYVLKALISFLLLLAVINQFWIDKHLLELEKKNQQFLENEKRLIQVELMNLKQQFQPHFLFNSLNSISALVGSEPKEARRMILLLSDFLRQSIRTKESDFEKLNDELDFLKLYLEIEKVRFGHRLNIDFQLDENTIDFKMPSQILQPLVENAIKYGLYGNIGELSIQIKIYSENQDLLIEITNPFDTSQKSQTKGTGFGLNSVKQKLNFLYKRNDLIKITQGDTFFVKLTIPQLND
ncbi:MAG: histidine kinase [Bacteroidota bacterium]